MPAGLYCDIMVRINAPVGNLYITRGLVGTFNSSDLNKPKFNCPELTLDRTDLNTTELNT